MDYGKNIPVAVLEIVDCQGHLPDGNKKDGTFICNQFLKYMKEIDPEKIIRYIYVWWTFKCTTLRKTFESALS